ncbi:amidase family protein [Granulicatella adiacens]|uniref:amidase family protein n=1 Tax=Granulicatella adiacens TaxID=46124 RepID=UPI001C3C3244|nr:amidase family protein [Granulicatella adiacens]MCT2160522.1 amidase family protein [Granulicatella adiacens]
MEKIQKYAYKTMLAMKNPLKSVDRVYPLAFDEISNHDGYYFGVKNSLYLTNAMEEKLKQCSYYLHTRDQSSLGGRAIDIDLKNPITGLPMTGSSSGTAINVFLGINDIGMGTDGGGSVLAPAISLNLFSVIDPLLFQEERKKEIEKVSTDGISFIPSIGLISKNLKLLRELYLNLRALENSNRETKILVDDQNICNLLKDENLEVSSFEGKYDNERLALIETAKRLLEKYDIIVSKEGPVDLNGFGDTVFGHFDDKTKKIQVAANKGFLRIANMANCFALTVPSGELSTAYVILCDSNNVSAIRKSFLIAESLYRENDALSERYFLNYKNYFMNGYSN